MAEAAVLVAEWEADPVSAIHNHFSRGNCVRPHYSYKGRPGSYTCLVVLDGHTKPFSGCGKSKNKAKREAYRTACKTVFAPAKAEA
jgi:hypothetical protein